MAIPFLKVKRCCFCTRKLKVACIFIAIWSMFALTHSTAIVLNPCCTEYKNYILHVPARLLKWIIFVVNMITLTCTFAFIIGLFWLWPVTADLLIAFGFITGILLLAYTIITIVQMIDSGCSDPSDVIIFIVYFILWMYFIIVINSHRDDMRKS